MRFESGYGGLNVTRRIHADRYAQPFLVRSFYDRTQGAAALPVNAREFETTCRHASITLPAQSRKPSAPHAGPGDGGNVLYRTDKSYRFGYKLTVLALDSCLPDYFTVKAPNRRGNTCRFRAGTKLFSPGGLAEALTNMRYERRAHHRVPTTLTVMWEGLLTNNYALMTDVSLGGCYINSVGRVSIDENIRVDTILLPRAHLHLEGSVAHREWPMGFGLRFGNLTDEKAALISRVVAGGV